MAKNDAHRFFYHFTHIIPGYNVDVVHSAHHRASADAYTVSGLIATTSNVEIMDSDSYCLPQKLTKQLLCTKSIIAMNIRFKGKTCCLMGAHFPFKSKDPVAWGNETRVNAMKNGIEYMSKKHPADYYILTSDLNFRQVATGDQLQTLLMEGQLSVHLNEKYLSFHTHVNV
jgi:hypothetical protein